MSSYESAYRYGIYGDRDMPAINPSVTEQEVLELKKEIEKMKIERIAILHAKKTERTSMLYAIEKANAINASLKNKLKADVYMRAQIEEMSVLIKKTCPICYEEYVSEGVEVLQNCGHTTCKTCFAELIRKRLCCPLCRAELNQ